MKQTITKTLCDRCKKELGQDDAKCAPPATTLATGVTLTIGSTPHNLDLCKGCASKLGRLLADFAEVAP